LQTLLACPVDFGSSSFVLQLSAECLEWPLPGHSPALLQVLREAMQRQLPRQAVPSTKSEQLLRWMRRQPDLGQITLDAAARHFECSPSTLRRWLAQESVKFVDLLQLQRSWRAFLGVLDRRRPLPEVAEGLGYADRAGLERAFQAVFGLRPAQLRQWASDVQSQRGLGLAAALRCMAIQARLESRPEALARSLSQAAETLPLDVNSTGPA
jgi:AraC-like DNA-binding protein